MVIAMQVWGPGEVVAVGAGCEYMGGTWSSCFVSTADDVLDMSVVSVECVKCVWFGAGYEVGVSR